MMSLWDALRMNMMISYQELVRTFLSIIDFELFFIIFIREIKITIRIPFSLFLQYFLADS